MNLFVQYSLRFEIVTPVGATRRRNRRGTANGAARPVALAAVVQYDATGVKITGTGVDETLTKDATLGVHLVSKKITTMLFFVVALVFHSFCVVKSDHASMLAEWRNEIPECFEKMVHMFEDPSVPTSKAVLRCLVTRAEAPSLTLCMRRLMADDHEPRANDTACLMTFMASWMLRDGELSCPCRKLASYVVALGPE